MRYLIILSILATMLALGCSGNGGISPTLQEENRIESSETHACWGMWQFIADPTTETLDAVGLRAGGMHLNALVFLEPPPLVNLTFENLQFNGDIIEVDIGLKHPFLALDEFTGFDVCGIFISNGSVSGFDDGNLVMAGEGDTRLLNGDGLSRWWNPAEFPVNEGTMLSYNDGLLGAPDSYADYNCTLNAYKYFCDELDVDDPIENVDPAARGVFSAGKKNVRKYIIEMNDGLTFNYAVDANWSYPTGGAPWTVPDDFGANANRPEAWRVQVTEVQNTLYNDGSESGGQLSLAMDVYDWFNADLNTVRVESPGNFTAVTQNTASGGGVGYSTYEIDITSATPSAGEIDILISVISGQEDFQGFIPGVNTTAYFMHTSSVSGLAPEPGWAVTWGNSSFWELPLAFRVDDSGNSYVGGQFMGSVDFDPGPGTMFLPTYGSLDIYLSKFDSSGSLLWAHSWGGSGDDNAFSVDVDASGYIYVAGGFSDSVDFDPGTSDDTHTSAGSHDLFLSKFDPSGNFLWARTWGGVDFDRCFGVGVNESDEVYVTGYFNGTADFDPGTGVENHISNGAHDIFLCKYDTSGNYDWTLTWGGEGSHDRGCGIAFDDSGYIYTTGNFTGPCDMDPGAGEDIHDSIGRIVYLSKFNPSGDFQWSKSWGAQIDNYGEAVAVDGGQDIYVVGKYTTTVDFDPGPGVDNRECLGVQDMFLSKFDASGNRLRTDTWGTAANEVGYEVAVDSADNVCITGWFEADDPPLDFDPGPGVDEHSVVYGSGPDLNRDPFLIKLDSSGDYLWGRNWGASKDDEGWGVGFDASGNVYSAGYFYLTVDFDPGPGVDEHTSNGYFDCFLSKFNPDGTK